MISIFWRTHLREVDFSDNALKELPSYIFELEVQYIHIPAVNRNSNSMYFSTATGLCFSALPHDGTVVQVK